MVKSFHSRRVGGGERGNLGSPLLKLRVGNKSWRYIHGNQFLKQ
jgi:hypothetical protein